MTAFKRRIFITLSFITLAAGCGTLGGYLLASAITVRVTEARLDLYASRIVADWESSSSELRTALAAMGASQYHSCSGEEIGYFRALIFESDYLKDAGRMRNGQVECSGAMGQLKKPLEEANPDFTQQDGTMLYTNLPQYRNGDLPVLTLQRGDYFVAFTPDTRLHLEPPPMHYIESAIDSPTLKSGKLLGESPAADAPRLTAEGLAHAGDSLYATRCSIRFFNCATAFTTLPEVLQSNRGKFCGCIALCALTGALFGLLLSLLYRRNKSMEQQLRRAIAKDKLRVAYQPIVNLDSGRIAGAEVLARWTDEQGSAVGPDVFVRIAEERGFVGEITELVVRHTLRDFGELLRSRDDFRLSVNVTATDLSNAEFLPTLEYSLKKAGVPARSIAIEITESSTARNGVAMETLRRLRHQGHSVHIDDFGTGYSSLAYLHDLSVDAIKIDKTFTQAIGTEAVTVTILPQILAMAEALDLEVIVEGIETAEQADYFRASGKRFLAQGWLFGRPLPAGEFRGLLAREGKREQVQADADSPAGDRLIHAA